MVDRMPPPQSALTDGLRVVLPGPGNVSLPANAQPGGLPVENMGPDYGIQVWKKWEPGDVRPCGVIDVRRADALWRVSAFGNVLLTIGYGTKRKRAITDLQAPLVIAVPGQVIVTATPRDANGTTCVVTLTQATDGSLSNARKFTSRGGADVALDEGAVRFFALTASTLTISGAAVVVPALDFVPLVAGAVLTSGSGFQEFEA